jgi:hypothetical protein
MGCLAPEVWGAEPTSLRTSLLATRPIAEFRLRSETVSQDGFTRRAESLSLRGRVGLQTGKVRGTALLGEGEFLSPWVSHSDNTVDGDHRYPVVADPRNLEINRLQLTNSTLAGTTLVLGRQRIVLDDQRFVANVGWRQNEQTYDAIRVTRTWGTAYTLDVAWIDQVNRVFGSDSPAGRYHGDSYLVNASHHSRFGTLTAFSYLLDFREAATDSTTTHGLRLSGSRERRSAKIAYAASIAHQSDRGGNPLAFSADYFAAELSGTRAGLTLTGGLEVLEGNGVKGFSTPLATLHKFQGWADKFLTTPPAGILDRYASISWSSQRVRPLDQLTAMLCVHTFEAEHGSITYGQEADLQLEAKYERFRMMLKYAKYDAVRFATDTRKYWAQIEFVL